MLEKKRADLRAKADKVFWKEPLEKRDEIEDELDAAKTVLADAGDAATRAAGSASRFVVDLAQAVETGAGPDTGKPARGKSGATGVARGRAPAAGPARGAAAPAAPPPPKKKAKGGDDFEP